MKKYQLDARRLLCPMPVIKTQDKVQKLQSGDLLEVICTDPGALNDIPAWARINGHEVIEQRDTGDEVMIVVKVS